MGSAHGVMSLHMFYPEAHLYIVRYTQHLRPPRCRVGSTDFAAAAGHRNAWAPCCGCVLRLLRFVPSMLDVSHSTALADRWLLLRPPRLRPPGSGVGLAMRSYQLARAARVWLGPMGATCPRGAPVAVEWARRGGGPWLGVFSFLFVLRC